jgi:hypothetical protein
MDTNSDPCNGEVLVGVGVSFNRESVMSDEEFTVFLFVTVSKSPIAVNKANGTIGFIEGSGTGRMFLI